jgi:hypothetical protein
MNTITKSELAEAARNTDALTEEYGLQETLRRRGTDLAGVMYIAQQRALRAAMIFDGKDPTGLSRTETTQIQLSPRAEEVLTILQAVALDGVAIGITVKQER